MSKPDYFISTPENVDLHLEFAGLGNRILACLIDASITYSAIAISFFACFLFLYIAHRFLHKLPAVEIILDVALAVATMIASFVIVFGYFIFFECSWQGQTPGKKLAGIRVIEANGQPASRSAIWIRNLMRTVDQGLMLIGLLVILIDSKERRLGDLAANTIVIRERQAGIATADLKPVHTNAQIEDLNISRINPEEYELLQSFFKRCKSLDHSHRTALAAQMQEYFAKKLEPPVKTDSPELFLQNLIAAYQARAEI